MSEAKKLAINITYRTNSAGINLFIMFAKVDGIGILLAYWFTETLASEDNKKQKDLEATTCLST